METSNNTSSSLGKSIINSKLGNISQDISEALIDSIFIDGFLKEIPLIGTAVNIFKLGSTISEHFYIKKILKFLFQLTEISESEKTSFLEKLSQSDSQELFVKIPIIVNSLDDLAKSEIIGTLFKNFIRGHLKSNEFLRLSSIVAKTYIEDLQYIYFHGLPRNIDSEEKMRFMISNDMEISKENLVFQGLMGIDYKENIDDRKRYNNAPQIVASRKLNKLGYLLCEFGFEGDIINRFL